MRNSIYVLMLLGCGPRGVSTDTDEGDEADADTDADADSDTDTDTDTDTGLGGGDCAAGPPTTGPWDDHPITMAGAPVQSTPYTNDAGVAALIAATVGNTDPTPVDLQITGATVVARGYVPANPTSNTADFWFEDAGGAMYWYGREIDLGIDPNTLKPGDKVSFHVTEVQDYFGTLEVTMADSFIIDSSANPIHVVDGMSGAPLSFATNGMQVVEIWGELVSGPTTDCQANCFQLQYGSDVVTFRTESTFDQVGDCIHWIGPLGSFGGDEQLNANDFDWYTFY